MTRKIWFALTAALALLAVTFALAPRAGLRDESAPSDAALPTIRVYRLAGPSDEEHPDIIFSTLRMLTEAPVSVLDITKPVPEECDLVLIDNPQKDLSELSANLLMSYLGRGGRLLLLTDYVYGAMPELNRALQEFGVSAIDGVVFDPESCMGGHPEYPVPTLTEHSIAQSLAQALMEPMMPLSHALRIEPLTGVNTESILTTSNSSYLQLNALNHNTLEQGENDLTGPFHLAVATESTGGRIVWIASWDMASEESDHDVRGANSALIQASIQWLLR